MKTFKDLNTEMKHDCRKFNLVGIFFVFFISCTIFLLFFVFFFSFSILYFCAVAVFGCGNLRDFCAVGSHTTQGNR